MSLRGHLWTILPTLDARVRRRTPPPSLPWSTTLTDEGRGELTLRGELAAGTSRDTLLLIIHGLGGSPDSPYCHRAAQAGARRGWSTLRLALRGADRRGEDFYHAGLTQDLVATLAAPPLRDHRRVFILGFSMGGHVALQLARETPPPPLRAVATVCAPLDLARSCLAIDRPGAALYRNHVLAGLKSIYRAVARRGRAPTPWEKIRAIKSIRQWDALAVVPRFGFESVEHYYRSCSAGPHLGQLRCPTLLVAGRQDPMVPLGTLESSLALARAPLQVCRIPGGHVGFGPNTDLGFGASGSVEDQVLGWLDRH